MFTRVLGKVDIIICIVLINFSLFLPFFLCVWPYIALNFVLSLWILTYFDARYNIIGIIFLSAVNVHDLT
jgi:hypothetical protein